MTSRSRKKMATMFTGAPSKSARNIANGIAAPWPRRPLLTAPWPRRSLLTALWPRPPLLTAPWPSRVLSQRTQLATEKEQAARKRLSFVGDKVISGVKAVSAFAG